MVPAAKSRFTLETLNGWCQDAMRLSRRENDLLEDTGEDENATWILSRCTARGIKRLLELLMSSAN
jgi:hypothetical protein